MNATEIAIRLERNGIEAGPELAEKLHIYLLLLKEWNSRMDLTAVAEDGETVGRHFIDSLTVLKTELIPHDASLIDVGTGAGFPGLALAMARPGLQVTLLDAQQKRLAFLQAVCEATGTDNTTLVHSRAEDGARRKELRERFDVATTRAVTRLPVLVELTVPLLKTGGVSIAYKGDVQEELQLSGKALSLLRSEAETVPVAADYGERNLVVIRKKEKTPKAYPRKPGTPVKMPL